jgi:hypothetical protein
MEKCVVSYRYAPTIHFWQTVWIPATIFPFGEQLAGATAFQSLFATAIAKPDLFIAATESPNHALFRFVIQSPNPK